MSQSQSETWTIGRLLTWTADYLKQHGAASPRLDAEVLLAVAAGCQRIDLYTRFDEPAPEALRTSFRELVRRRAEGTPVAYLVGRREFYSLSFRVTPDVLIPRPETEFLVVALLDRLRPRAAAGAVSVADVGTGSGIIAICAAKYVPQAQVTAIDISRQALAVAQANAEDLKVAERIEWIEGDLLAGLPAEQAIRFHRLESALRQPGRIRRLGPRRERIRASGGFGRRTARDRSHRAADSPGPRAADAGRNALDRNQPDVRTSGAGSAGGRRMLAPGADDQGFGRPRAGDRGPSGVGSAPRRSRCRATGG